MAEDKNKELLEKLEKGIVDTMNGEKYKAFLTLQSQFHTYSFNNAMLIYLQRPDATMVAGYESWKKLERQVMRGEKGISILAPSPYKTEKQIDKIDPKTNKPIIDPATGKPEQVTINEQRLSFRKVTVFDVKQTDGKELPSICNELQGNSINSEKLIKAIKEISDYPVIEKNIESGTKGYFSRGEGIIAVKEGMSLDQTVKTLIHELAHSKLHNTDAAALLDRATKEVQAESVAFIVSDRFGVDTSQYSFEYLASWSSDKNLKELKGSFSLIQKTSNDIIQKVEDVLSKELQLEYSPAKIKILWSEHDQLNTGQIMDFKEANELFTKLEAERFELRKSNSQASCIKTEIELELSDGRTYEIRFDIGAGDYKNLAECLKQRSHIDVEKYMNEYPPGNTKEQMTIEEFNNKYKMSIHKPWGDRFYREPDTQNLVLDRKGLTYTDEYKIENDLSLTVGEFYERYVGDKISNIYLYELSPDNPDVRYSVSGRKFYGEDAFERIKKEFNLVPNLSPQHICTKDKIIELYSKEFPSIKHISDSTASIINTLNKDKEHPLTIKDIKARYIELGKKFELSLDIDVHREFKLFKDVVDDLKQAQLTNKKELAHEKSLEKQLTKTKTMEFSM